MKGIKNQRIILLLLVGIILVLAPQIIKPIFASSDSIIKKIELTKVNINENPTDHNTVVKANELFNTEIFDYYIKIDWDRAAKPINPNDTYTISVGSSLIFADSNSKIVFTQQDGSSIEIGDVEALKNSNEIKIAFNDKVTLPEIADLENLKGSIYVMVKNDLNDELLFNKQVKFFAKDNSPNGISNTFNLRHEDMSILKEVQIKDQNGVIRDFIPNMLAGEVVEMNYTYKPTRFDNNYLIYTDSFDIIFNDYPINMFHSKIGPEMPKVNDTSINLDNFVRKSTNERRPEEWKDYSGTYRSIKRDNLSTWGLFLKDASIEPNGQININFKFQYDLIYTDNDFANTPVTKLLLELNIFYVNDYVAKSLNVVEGSGTTNPKFSNVFIDFEYTDDNGQTIQAIPSVKIPNIPVGSVNYKDYELDDELVSELFDKGFIIDEIIGLDVVSENEDNNHIKTKVIPFDKVNTSVKVTYYNISSGSEVFYEEQIIQTTMASKDFVNYIIPTDIQTKINNDNLMVVGKGSITQVQKDSTKNNLKILLNNKTGETSKVIVDIEYKDENGQTIKPIPPIEIPNVPVGTSDYKDYELQKEIIDELFEKEYIVDKITGVDVVSKDEENNHVKVEVIPFNKVNTSVKVTYYNISSGSEVFYEEQIIQTTMASKDFVNYIIPTDIQTRINNDNLIVVGKGSITQVQKDSTKNNLKILLNNKTGETSKVIVDIEYKDENGQTIKPIPPIEIPNVPVGTTDYKDYELQKEIIDELFEKEYIVDKITGVDVVSKDEENNHVKVEVIPFNKVNTSVKVTYYNTSSGSEVFYAEQTIQTTMASKDFIDYIIPTDIQTRINNDKLKVTNKGSIVQVQKDPAKNNLKILLGLLPESETTEVTIKYINKLTKEQIINHVTKTVPLNTNEFNPYRLSIDELNAIKDAKYVVKNIISITQPLRPRGSEDNIVLVECEPFDTTMVTVTIKYVDSKNTNISVIPEKVLNVPINETRYNDYKLSESEIASITAKNYEFDSVNKLSALSTDPNKNIITVKLKPLTSTVTIKYTAVVDGATINVIPNKTVSAQIGSKEFNNYKLSQDEINALKSKNYKENGISSLTEVTNDANKNVVTVSCIKIQTTKVTVRYLYEYSKGYYQQVLKDKEYNNIDLSDTSFRNYSLSSTEIESLRTAGIGYKLKSIKQLTSALSINPADNVIIVYVDPLNPVTTTTTTSSSTTTSTSTRTTTTTSTTNTKATIVLSTPKSTTTSTSSTSSTPTKSSQSGSGFNPWNSTTKTSGSVINTSLSYPTPSSTRTTISTVSVTDLSSSGVPGGVWDGGGNSGGGDKVNPPTGIAEIIVRIGFITIAVAVILLITKEVKSFKRTK